jgi:outer membrane protein OmpA-like peptidoglycan-associated protein
MKIELSSHTDSYGANDYNLKLSDNRAKSVVDYLIKSGITSNRLTFKGFGEDQPISTNETVEGRQLNRRTEFKITSM